MSDEAINYSLRAFGRILESIAEVLRRPEKENLPHIMNSIMGELDGITAEINEKIVWTEQQAALSGLIHTCFRKYSDSYITSALYEMVRNDKGKRVWQHFIINLLKTNKAKKLNWSLAFRNIEAMETVGSDDFVFKKLLLAMMQPEAFKHEAAMIEEYFYESE